METERLIIDQIKETDKEDYFINISHDNKVLETFICRYADTMEEFDFSSYPGRQDLFAIRLKDTGRLIGIIFTSMKKKIPVRSATGSVPGSGIRGTQLRRPRGFWNTCSGRKECVRYMHLSLPGMMPPAV